MTVTLAYLTDGAHRWFRGWEPRIGADAARIFDACGVADDVELARLLAEHPREVAAWIKCRDGAA